MNRSTVHGLGDLVNWDSVALGSLIYAATNTGLGISQNGGTSFVNRLVADGLGSNQAQDVKVSGNNVYVATTGGLSISNDGGTSFINRSMADGLPDNEIKKLHLSPAVVASNSSADTLPQSLRAID